MITLLLVVSVLLNAYLIYREVVSSGKLTAIEQEFTKIETEAVTDAKAVIARIKALL